MGLPVPKRSRGRPPKQSRTVILNEGNDVQEQGESVLCGFRMETRSGFQVPEKVYKTTQAECPPDWICPRCSGNCTCCECKPPSKRPRTAIDEEVVQEVILIEGSVHKQADGQGQGRGFADNKFDSNGENGSLNDVDPKFELAEITEPTHCRSLRLPFDSSSVKRLIYTSSGNEILGLFDSAVCKLWKWKINGCNSTGKATASVIPLLWKPIGGALMPIDIGDASAIDFVPCIALSTNDSCVVSASGGNISVFDMRTSECISKSLPPPAVVTVLTFHPQDSNVIAIGMKDSSIHIYNVGVDEVKTTLEGHEKQITGLSFSSLLNVLVSSGADSLLCVWNTNGWEKQMTTNLQVPAGRVAGTSVQFHQDQTHLLAVHATQIAIFKAPKLESPEQWSPTETSGLITNATYSCDGQLIFVVFESGSVGILVSSTLTLRCRISSTAFLPSNPKIGVRPLVIAAHPYEPDQFALGLSDGGVLVLEPLESDGKWCSRKEKIENVMKIPEVTMYKAKPEETIPQLCSPEFWLESKKFRSCTLSLFSNNIHPKDYTIQFENPNTGEIICRACIKYNEVETIDSEKGVYRFIIRDSVVADKHVLIVLEIKGYSEASKFHKLLTDFYHNDDGSTEKEEVEEDDTEEVKIQEDGGFRKEVESSKGPENVSYNEHNIGKDDDIDQQILLDFSKMMRNYIDASTSLKDMKISELEEEILELKEKVEEIEKKNKVLQTRLDEESAAKTLEIEGLKKVLEMLTKTSKAASRIGKLALDGDIEAAISYSR